MIAPERWYEHQKNYQRYGFDMKPEPELRTKRKRAARKRAVVTGGGKKLAFSTVLVVGIAMIMLIIITAYSAGIRYDINSMIKENQSLMGEIENLEVKVFSANNVDYVEGKATGELAMVYPPDESRIHISSEDMPELGFADIIREKAYN